MNHALTPLDATYFLVEQALAVRPDRPLQGLSVNRSTGPVSGRGLGRSDRRP